MNATEQRLQERIEALELRLSKLEVPKSKPRKRPRLRGAIITTWPR